MIWGRTPLATLAKILKNPQCEFALRRGFPHKLKKCDAFIAYVPGLKWYLDAMVYGHDRISITSNPFFCLDILTQPHYAFFF